MKTALQMYSVRAFMGEDQIRNTLARVKDMGYDGAEWYGLLGYTPHQLAKLTTDAGLAMFSLHISIADLLSPDEEFLKETAETGVKYLPIGYLPEDRLAGSALFGKTCDLIARYAEKAETYGLRVLYHNHDFDLKRVGDSTALDCLYDALPGNVLGAEPDTCWLYSGGVSVTEYLTKYRDRAPVIHLKDCVKDGGRAGFCPLGMGVLDFGEILPRCTSADWVCVEQDEPSCNLDAFGCAEASINHLKKLMAEKNL
ncbi:MAG: sugar phosphate isomerase/epimerase [Clostridia bacterium]|nr:sugar phosphate isomerase/epimerase [Clostridia bacterium]